MIVFILGCCLQLSCHQDDGDVQYLSKHRAEAVKSDGTGKYTRMAISSSSFTDADLRVVGRFEDLEHLKINESKLTDEGLVFIKSLKKLNVLDLRNNIKLRGIGIGNLKECHLYSLFLSGCPVDDEAMKHIIELESLRSLSLAGTKISDKSLALVAKMKKLETLSLDQTKLTNAGIAHLKVMPKLTTLYLDKTAISDDFLANGPRNLTWLSISGTEVTDKSIKQILELEHLEVLNVRSTKITAKGVLILRQKSPRLTIECD